MQQAHRLRVRRFHAAPVHHRRAVRGSVAGAQPVPRHSGGRGRRRRRTATALLRRYKLPFGVACRCTAENAERVATELYYDRVIATGAKFCWFFTCPAYGPEQPASLEQLEAIHRRVQEFRRSKPLLTLDFWDGPSPSAAAPQGGTA